MANKYSPGKGWHELSPAVYENGHVRIHLNGLCRMKAHTFVIDRMELNTFVRINGGNRKRGMMSWAKSLEGEDERT